MFAAGYLGCVLSFTLCIVFSKNSRRGQRAHQLLEAKDSAQTWFDVLPSLGGYFVVQTDLGLETEPSERNPYGYKDVACVSSCESSRIPGISSRARVDETTQQRSR
jgi:hypothetical protein